MSKEMVQPKILIVDDDNQSRYMLTFLFESNNYMVYQSTNGVDAIAKAKSSNPDTIILDIQLPLMNGYDVIKGLKVDNGLKNIPIVVVTSFAMNGDMNKAMEAGADGYIAKPINPDTFVSQIESLIPSLRMQ